MEEKPKSEKELLKIKRWAAKEFKTTLPSNLSLNQVYQELTKSGKIKRKKTLDDLFVKKKTRTLSGVAIVSVLTKPYFCPGKCVYCPTEKGIPKSYLSGEPAVERAKALKYNPHLQVKKRIEMLKAQGHSTDKIELRIIGGSFSVYPARYKKWFIKRCFEAANEKNFSSIKLAQNFNEKTKNRIVGISIETRPDLIDQKEIKTMRELGITMVEIGVQTVFDEILKKSKRGHGIKEIIKTTKLLKDTGFKVMYHLMPNLPGANLKIDEEMFKEVFKNPAYKPDWLKIYPCVATKEAKIYKLQKQKKWKPYSDKNLINLLVKIKISIPHWIRIARVYRDIPTTKITGGSQFSNLRESIEKKMKKENYFCKCIRCREVKGEYDKNEKIFLFKEEYESSEGKEVFLSFETKSRKKLYAYLRLRLPSPQKPQFKILENSSIIREIHTFGKATPIGKKALSPQHKGFGKKLIKEAENISRKEGFKKIAAISGIGAKEYWRKQGYKLKETYMAKEL